MDTGYPIVKKSILPDSPGVYQFFNSDSELIYVGKAKSLKKRVFSYFNKNNSHNRKTLKLVREIVSFNFVIVNNETDALLLENNLIKQNQPRYNILLKDDKTFPYICIIKEAFPRVIKTRKLDPEKGEYFGPYSSVVAMNTVLDLIRKLYTIRTCKLNLSESSILKNSYKVCLEYHLGNCLGPCERLQSETDYLMDIQSARNILKGNLTEVTQYFKTKMANSSANLEFEEAQNFKDKIDLVERFKQKSIVVNPKLSDLNVFTIINDDKMAIINFMHIENGAIVKTKTLELKKVLNESDAELLTTIAFNELNDAPKKNKLILSNVSFSLENYEVSVPQIGDKKKLIQLSLKNGLEYKKNKLLHKSEKDKSKVVLQQLQSDLNLEELPDHIECFDNSNIQGANPVASMVCFKNGKPSKKDYRHFNIKTVVGPDDFASMKEVVGRRYKRLINENLSLPKLIVIDGGKGQLSSACDALKENGVYGLIPIIGIAKRLEEIYFPEDSYPIHINKKSVSLRLLQHLRDEAHRFAITFHRQKRSKSSLQSELHSIKGIGEKSEIKLLKNFKSFQRVKNATLNELTNLLGDVKGKSIYQQLHKTKKED